MNAQPWAFAVVQDTARLKRYSDRAKGILLANIGHHHKTMQYDALLRDESFNIFYNASTQCRRKRILRAAGLCPRFTAVFWSLDPRRAAGGATTVMRPHGVSDGVTTWLPQRPTRGRSPSTNPHATAGR